MPLPYRRVAVFALTLALAACGGGGASAGDRTVKVRGRLPVAARVSGRALRSLAAADPSTATKIILVGTNGVAVKPVVSGTFEVDVMAEVPVALILAGPGDTFLGYVAVRSIVPLLPLQAADKATAVLDLGTLVAAAGGILAPGVDPIGNGITLTDPEVQQLADLGQVTRMVLSNPDVDGDGVIDFLQGRQYAPQVLMAGGGDLAGQVGDPATLRRAWTFGYMVMDDDAATYPATATFTGPAGSGVTGAQTPCYLGMNHSAICTAPWQQGAVPAAGTWTSGFGDRTLIFQLPDLAPLVAAAPTAVPTVDVGQDGLVKSVSWVWRLADGSTLESPSRLARSVLLQLQTTTTPQGCADKGMSGSNYNASLASGALAHALTCPNVPWSTVQSVSVSFTDVYANTFGAQYWVPAWKP